MTVKLFEVSASSPTKISSMNPTSTRTFRVLAVNSDEHPAEFQRCVTGLLKSNERITGMVELVNVSEVELRKDCRVWGIDALSVQPQEVR